MTFSPEQTFALEQYFKGHNLFLTGGGGTGKSKWIQHVAATSKKRVQVCALTGCAAILLNCNAKTLHSWAGIGLGDANKALANSYVCKRWKTTQVLIIDEVSMMSMELFDLLNTLGQTIRKSSKPFGGIQLICCEDFYQLPPVKSNFCFESASWSSTFQHCIEFKTMFRQKDHDLQTIMNEIRTGSLSQSSLDMLSTRIQTSDNCTKLVPIRQSADFINTMHYNKLTSDEHVFKMTSSSINAYAVDYLKKNVQCDEIIRLKIGTQVMCIINLNETICNGSQGIVVGFNPHPIVKFGAFDMVIAPHTWSHEADHIIQIPLIYAWAITIHKAQGATLQRAEIDLGDSVFEYGQIYVALSRITTLDGLFLTKFNAQKIKSHPKVIEYYKSFSSNSINAIAE
jgi:ATP-dependent DNA helicase PIF1